jgi:hypothetical protein
MSDQKPYLDGNTLWLPYDLAALNEVLDRLDTAPPPPPPGYVLYPGDDPAELLAQIPDPAPGTPMEELDTMWLADGTHPYPIHLTKRVNVRAVAGAAPVVSGWRSVEWEVFTNPLGERAVYRTRWNRDALGLSHHVVTNAAFLAAVDGPARMAAHNFATQPEMVAYDGEPLRRVSPSQLVSLREELTQAYDDKAGWLYIVLPSGHDLSRVQVATLPQLFTAADGVAGITVEGITFTGCANTHKQAAFTLHSDRNTLLNLHVDTVNSLGYSIRGIGLTMDTVTADDCGQAGFWFKVQKSQITGCGHAGSNWRGSDPGWHADKWEQCIDNTVNGWYAIDTNSVGLWLDIGNHGNTFEALDLLGCGKNAIMVEHYAERNTFSGRIRGTRPLGRWAGADVQIQSNVKGNVFDGLDIQGDLVPHWLVYKVTGDPRGPSGPNEFRNISTGGRPKTGAHEKDTWVNVA